MVGFHLLEIRVQAKKVNTDLKRWAAAVQQMLQEPLQTLGMLDGGFDFFDLAPGQVLPTSTHGRAVAQPCKKDSDLLQCEAHAACEEYEKQSVNDCLRISALPANAVGMRQQAYSLVITNC